MARPARKGLSYFPLDTDFMSDRKIQRLTHQYGCEGICIYLCVLCEIYGENGYFIHYDNDFNFDISFTLGIDEKRVQEVVSFCVQIHLFDSELLEYRQILSSEGIQERFKEINKRYPKPIEPELDLTVKKETTAVYVPETGVMDTTIPVLDTKTPKMVTEMPAKGNIKGKGNINNTNTQNSKFYGNEDSTDKEEAGRRAELLRMAADAARCDRNA